MRNRDSGEIEIMDTTYEVIQAGDRLQLDDGHFVKLVKKIGDGFTAVVFIAEPEDKNWQRDNIVIKIAKPQTETQNYVREEYETLIDLSTRIMMRGLPITPRVYGKGTIIDRSFIAMELLPGSPVLGKDEIIKLEEREALEAYYFIYSFLDQLHEKGITYPDLKMENFFWNPDSHDLKLRVLDFGAMGKTSDPSTDAQCHRELFRVGLGLFSSLTGRQLLLSASGEIIENLNEVLQRHQLSYGTKLLLRRLLNQSKDHRFLLANDVKNEIDGLLKFWNYDQDTLFSKFEANVLRAESIVVEGDSRNAFEDKFACTKRAMSAIDIYQLRFGKTEALLEDTTKKLNALISASSYLNEAKRLLLLRDFSNANAQLKTGAAFAESPEPYHLWEYLFEEALIIRESQLEAIVEGVDQVVDSYENGKLEAAHLLISNLSDSYQDTRSLTSIRNYIQFKKYLEMSENSRLNKDYQKAIEEFNKAKEAFSLLPNNVDLSENYYKDFPGRFKLLADEAEQYNIESRRPIMTFGDQMRQYDSGNLKAITDHYRRLLQIDILREEEQNTLERVVIEILRKGDISSAFSLAEIINHVDAPSDALRELRDSIRLLVSLKYSIVTENLHNAMITLDELVNKHKAADYLTVPLRNLFKELAKTDLVKLPDETKNKLKEISITLGDQQSQKIIDQAIIEANEALQRKLHPIIRQLELDLIPIENWHSELDNFVDEVQSKSFRQLESMVESEGEYLADISSRIDHLSNYKHLDNTLGKKLEVFSKEVERRKAILESKSASLPLIRQKFEEKVNQTVNEWNLYRLGGSGSYTAERANSLLSRTVRVMTEAASFFGDTSVFDKIAPDVLAEFDLQGIANWEVLLPSTDKDLPTEVSNVLSEVRKHMLEGRLQQASFQMQRLDPRRQLYPQSITTKIELLKLLAYEKRLKQYSEDISLRRFSNELIEVILEGESVPGAYSVLKAQGVIDYLQSLIKQRRSSLDQQVQKLRSNLRKSEEPDDLSKKLIFEYISLRQASKFIESIGVEDGKKV